MNSKIFKLSCALFYISHAFTMNANAMGVVRTVINVGDTILDTVKSAFGGTITVRCPKNGHYCSAPIGFYTSKVELQHSYEFSDGTDYQNARGWNGDMSVNKVFGATDCGEKGLGDTSKKDSVMFGWRNLKGGDSNLIELSGFINRKPNDLFLDGRYYQFAHLLVIPRNQKASLGLRVVGNSSGNYYLFSAGSTSNLIMARRCQATNNPHFNGRTITPWFGGKQAAPQSMKLKEKSIEFDAVSNVFPKVLKIADQENICKNVADPIAYLKGHASGIYSEYQSECGSGKELAVEVLGCDRLVDSSNGHGPIEFKDGIASIRYKVSCNAVHTSVAAPARTMVMNPKNTQRFE